MRNSSPLSFLALGILATAMTLPGCGGGSSSTSTPSPVSTADFGLALAQGSASLRQGGTATGTLTVSPLNGFTGTVVLAASGLPTGVTAAFSAIADGTATLTLSAEATATLGTSVITITGTSGTLVHTATLSLTVSVLPDFTLTATPAALTLGTGTTGTVALTVAPGADFTGEVALSASGLPAGVTASFSPVSTAGTSTLTLTAAASATLGDATVTVTGTSGELSHTAPIALKVAASDFTLTRSTDALSVIQGSDGTVAITVAALNGFSGSVAFSVDGLPDGVTAAFGDLSAAGTRNLTLTAGSAAALGTAPLTVTGVSGTLTHTVDIALTVLAPAAERTWTRNGFSFNGTYVKSSGVYNSSVTRHAEIAITSGPLQGRHRSWPISSFSSDDIAYINARIAAEKPADRDPFLGSYKAKAHSYGYTAATAGVNTLETDHFIFWWGSTTPWSDSLTYSQYLEDLWSYDRFVLGLTMPYQVVPDNPVNLSDKNRYKINVFIDGTGLPNSQPNVGNGGAWAWGSTEICEKVGTAIPGDGVIAHEFGHVLQTYSMGALGWGFGPAGWAWENFAQFHQYQAMPDAPNQLNWWWITPHWRPEDVTGYCQYTSWAWIIGLDQDGAFPSSFTSDIWWNDLRNPVKGNSAPDTTENIIQTIIRYGGLKGYLDSDNPTRAFGDVMGRFAARSLTMDYLGSDTLMATKGTTSFIPTEAVPDRSGWYRPTWGMAPYQLGTHVIQLAAEDGATSVTVEVNSLADGLDEQDMRSTLVIVNADGVPRYSYTSNGNIPLRGSGTLTMAISSGETPYLAVASVPLDTYRPALQHHGFQAFRPLHYEFKATGAAPVAPATYAASGTRLATHQKNADGTTAGFIASTATVADSAYVGADAVVLGSAQILGQARIEGHALVKGSAIVQDYAVVSDYAQINGGTLSGHARVRDNATVNAATVTESAAIYGKAVIYNTGTISGKAIIKDDSAVDISYGSVDGTITGSTLVAQCADMGVNSKVTLSQGRFYESCKTDYLDDTAATGVTGGNIFTAEAKAAENGNYLFANLDFDHPGTGLAMDAWANNDAVLRGFSASDFSTVTEDGTSRSILSLNGTDQYLVLDPRTFDSTDTTLDLMVKFNDTTTEGQRVFDFGASAETCLYLTPNEGGQMKLVLTQGGTSLVAAAAVPSPGIWTNLRVEMDGTSLRLYQDGVQVASVPTTVLPMDLNATRNFLGRSQAGAGFLNGALDHVRVYRTVVAGGAFSTASGQVPGVPPAAQRYTAISHIVK